MSLPKSYLTSSKNLPAILGAIQGAKAPETFTQRFLESLGFKSTTDRLIIGVLKSIRFLNDSGTPTERYYQFLDKTEAPHVLAEGIQEAYEDLFQVNTNAHQLQRQEVINKLKTLSQGQISDSVADKMAMTFQELCKLANFKAPQTKKEAASETPQTDKSEGPEEKSPSNLISSAANLSTRQLGGLHYNIQIILPESRDPKVYDALFQSLKTHLF
jgi:hypothetical protein